MRLKWLASRLFTQPFIQAQIPENTKAPCHWPLWGEFSWAVTSEFPVQRASNAENASIWWRHHDVFCCWRPHGRNGAQVASSPSSIIYLLREVPGIQCLTQALRLYSLSGRTSYREKWSIEAASFGFRLFQSFWILTGNPCQIFERYDH